MGFHHPSPELNKLVASTQTSIKKEKSKGKGNLRSTPANFKCAHMMVGQTIQKKTERAYCRLQLADIARHTPPLTSNVE